MNAEQKERAIQLITTWRTRSITTRPDESAVCGDCMTDILQELVDAPEPEPVAKTTGYYGGHLTISTVDGRVLPFGTALYLAQPAPSVLDELSGRFTAPAKLAADLPTWENGDDPLVGGGLISRGVVDFATVGIWPTKPAPSVPDGWSSFLTDVITAAGLIAHGKRDKGLASRIGKFAFDAMRAAQPQPEPPADLVRDAELWAPIADFNGVYEVSTIGRIRSVTRIDSDNNRRLAKYLTPTAIRKGYLKVCLWNGGERIERYVHRLVASAFIENPGHLPQVNHKDGDPANNEVSNLEWVTNAQNQTHARRILAKGVRAVYGISLTDGSRIDFASLELAVEAGFVRANIQKCISGTRKKHKGYAWYDAAIERDKKGMEA